MSCDGCDEAHDGSRGIVFIRVGNKEIGFGNVGLLACDAHAKLVLEALRKEAER